MHAGRFSPNQHQCMAKNSCCEAFMGCTLRSQNWLAKEAASAVVRISCFLWEHAGCCEPVVRGLFAGLADVRRLTCTPRACSFANQRFLGCIWGGNSPWSELICGHGGCLLTKEAASNTCTVQNGRKSQRYCQYSMQTQGAPNSPFQGLPEYTLPTGHPADSNEATMAPTLENPPRWHKCYRPREICLSHVSAIDQLMLPNLNWRLTMAL